MNCEYVKIFATEPNILVDSGQISPPLNRTQEVLNMPFFCDISKTALVVLGFAVAVNAKAQDTSHQVMCPKLDQKGLIGYGLLIFCNSIFLPLATLNPLFGSVL